MQTDKNKNTIDEIKKEEVNKDDVKTIVGQTNFDVFDAVLKGGLAVSFVSDSQVKTCAIFKFAGMSFEVVKANQEVECEGGIAVAVDTNNGTRWAYKKDASVDS